MIKSMANTEYTVGSLIEALGCFDKDLPVKLSKVDLFAVKNAIEKMRLFEIIELFEDAEICRFNELATTISIDATYNQDGEFLMIFSDEEFDEDDES